MRYSLLVLPMGKRGVTFSATSVRRAKEDYGQMLGRGGFAIKKENKKNSGRLVTARKSGRKELVKSPAS